MSKLVRETERHDFHFELGHLGPIDSFHLCAGAKEWRLQRHTPETLAAQAAVNQAIAIIPTEKRAAITHYVEGVKLPADRALMLRVEYAGGVALLALHTPRAARESHRAHKRPLFIPLLWRYGIDPYYSGPDAVSFSIVADGILSTMSTATGLVFQQPQLATINPVTATIVVDDHINAPANALNVGRLSGTIARQGMAWMTATPSTGYQGQTLTWGPFFSQSGQAVSMNQLSDDTVSGLGAPSALPLTTVLNDPNLQGSSWSTLQGIASVMQDTVAPAEILRLRRRPRAAALGVLDESSDFAVTNRSPGYGLDIDDSSLVFTPDGSGGGSLSINVTNNYLRSLWAWVQFFDTSGPLGPYQSVDLVSPVNVILGIPAPTDPTTLTFDWPEGATSATLAHGGLGVSNWQDGLVWNGIILTAVFNYAIPMLFLYAGASDDDNSALTTMEKEKTITDSLFEAAQSVVGSLASNSIGFPNVKTILSAFADGIAGFLVHAGLEALQDYLVEQLGEAGLEKAIPFANLFFEVLNSSVDLIEVGETTVEVLCSPAVYEVSIVRSMPLSATASPDPTHGSPGVPAVWPFDSDHYQCVVQYQGGTFFTAVGPMVGASSSEPITVSFESIPEGGTLQIQFGVFAQDETLLGNWTSAWVPAVRPAPGETLTLTGAIQELLVPLTNDTQYNYKEKLVYANASHVWQPEQFSITATAIPDLNNQQIDSATATAFVTNGVTLVNPTVQVLQAGQRWNIVDTTQTYPLVYSSEANGVIVTTSNAPTAVLPLPGGDTGNNLGATVGITLNDKAYMLGYCWTGSGEDVPPARTGGPKVMSQINTFQSINSLSPDTGFKFPGVGYANQPFIVYDQFGPAPLFYVPSTYTSELNGGTVSSGLTTLFQQFGYALPGSGVTVTVNQASVSWTIVVNGADTYTLQSSAAEIGVFAYPAVTISQNNFFLEPTSTDPQNYQYQARQVVLDDTTPFNVDQTVSWGLFQLPHLTDAAVHPQGYIVGAHATINVIEILPIPDQAVPDAQAQPATLIGGAGTRPGLFGSPTAITVTADGRILVLEAQNGRIQAMDVGGNPVSCFGTTPMGSVAPSEGPALDDGLVSTSLRAFFAQNNMPLSNVWRVQDSAAIYQLALSADGTSVDVTTAGASPSTAWKLTDSSESPQMFDLELSQDASTIAVSQNGTQLFTAPATDLGILNAGLMTDDLSTAFDGASVTLVSPLQIAGNGLTLDPSVVGDLSQGNIPASLAPALAAAGYTLGSPASVTASTTVTAIASGSQWQLADGLTRYGLQLDASSGEIFVTPLSPVMSLQPPPQGQTLTYTGLSTETRGYIFVLSHIGIGNAATDFLLDIYSPDGGHLSTTQGVNAGDIVVDQWRNLYTLNFETFIGAGGRTEPSISVWTPSV